jgi:hypothetical protein
MIPLRHPVLRSHPQYALFEELVANDMDRAAQVYAAALALVPHATFTFGKLWLLRYIHTHTHTHTS